MKNQRLTVRRRPARSGGLTTLFANVARRKKKRHRAATTASSSDFDGDVPNLGIAKALVAILIIHVIAIGGIFFHSRWLENEESPAAGSDSGQTVKRVAIATGGSSSDLPRIQSGESLYTAGNGETYMSIAERFGVDEMTLRKLNENIPVREGRYLRIPPKPVPVSPPVRDGGDADAIVARAELEAPRAVPVDEDLVVTDAARRVDAGGSPATTSGTSYKVKPGDTFWGIAQKYNTSVDKLMALNGIDDPKKLRVGMNLDLPR
jgi:LysM repeat protein